MIKNQRQYNITNSQANKFEAAIAELKSQPQDSHISPLLRKAERAALESQLAELRSELKEYENLQKKGAARKRGSLAELPSALIQARIARKITQKQLAKLIKVDEQQIQRYEASDYDSVSLPRLTDIADALGVTMTFEATKGAGMKTMNASASNQKDE